MPTKQRPKSEHPGATWDDDPAVIYSLDNELRIKYCNRSWDRFAKENGGVGLEGHLQIGRSVLDSIPSVIREHYAGVFRQVLETAQPWTQLYECSSTSQYRSFQMLVYPEPANAGLLIIHSLVVEFPLDAHTRVALPPDLPVYVDANGITQMCCYCRRTKRAGGPEWDWVPAFVTRVPRQTSHGVCGVCHSLYLAPNPTSGA